MASHNDFGKAAEEMAVKYLSEKGHAIIERNYRFHKAELDIISEIGDLLVITEVKARSDAHFMEPYEAVNIKKKRLLLQAANHYVTEKELEKEVRFDIISMVKKEDGSFEILHIEEAFEAFTVS